MPLTYHIEGSLLHGASSGRITDASCREVRTAIAIDPDYRPDTDELWDLSVFDSFEISPNGIRDSIVRWKRHGDLFTGNQCAYVAPSDLVYGMARIFETLASDAGLQIRTFRSPVEAGKWLRQDAYRATPLASSAGEVSPGYQIRVSEHDRYLRFQVSGTRKVEEAENLLRRVAGASAARKLYRVLLVLELGGRFSTFEIHDIVSNYREYGLGPEHKLAVVDKNEESAMDQQFAEDVARTRGLNGASFKNEEDALIWLLA